MAVTRAEWAEAFLATIGKPLTPANVQAITAWEVAEGGAWGNDAAYNPLNTTLREPGSRGINDLGNGVAVQAFTSWQQGMTANADVIGESPYQGIMDALSAGNNAQAVAEQVAASPWGTSPFSASEGELLTARQIAAGAVSAAQLQGTPAGGAQNPASPPSGPGFDWNPLSWPGQLLSSATSPVTGTIQEAVVLAPILLGAAALAVVGLFKATGANKKLAQAGGQAGEAGGAAAIASMA